MLQGYSVPLSPRGIANLAAKPPWHYAGVVVGAEFWTDPGAAAATLPDGLTPDPESAGRGTVLFIDWQYSGSRDEYLDPVRSQYHEFFVLLDARWQDTPVAWCPYIYVDNDQALARGWIQGFPKKLGTVAQTRTFAVASQAAPVLGRGGRLAATVSAAGYRLANALITLQAPMADPGTLAARPMVNLRHFPRLAAGQQDNPAVHELVMALFDDQTITNAWTGSSELEFPEVPGEELHDLRRCGPGRASASSSPTPSPTCGPTRSACSPTRRRSHEHCSYQPRHRPWPCGRGGSDCGTETCRRPSRFWLPASPLTRRWSALTALPSKARPAWPTGSPCCARHSANRSSPSRSDPSSTATLLCGRWHLQGQYAGGMPGATAAPGSPVDFTGTDILRIEGGLLAEYWLNSDVHVMAAQLGMTA